MSRYRVTPQAQADFDVAYDYLSEKSEAAAHRLELDLVDAFIHLGAWPDSGRLRPEVTSAPIRFWISGSYIIIYDPIPRPINILAVLHGAQDIHHIFRERFPSE